jgi:hypothetical protein
MSIVSSVYPYPHNLLRLPLLRAQNTEETAFWFQFAYSRRPTALAQQSRDPRHLL